MQSRTQRIAHRAGASRHAGQARHLSVCHDASAGNTGDDGVDPRVGAGDDSVRGDARAGPHGAITLRQIR
jgi:hypothetical protein